MIEEIRRRVDGDLYDYPDDGGMRRSDAKALLREIDLLREHIERARYEIGGVKNTLTGSKPEDNTYETHRAAAIKACVRAIAMLETSIPRTTLNGQEPTDGNV